MPHVWPWDLRGANFCALHSQPCHLAHRILCGEERDDPRANLMSRLGLKDDAYATCRSGGGNVAIGERRRSEAKWMKWIRRWIPADPSDRTLPQLQAVTGLDGCSAATCTVDWLVAAATLIHSRVRRPQSEKPGKFRKARPRHEKSRRGSRQLISDASRRMCPWLFL